MLEHAYAPGRVPAPELYARYTCVRELRIPWEALGGIEPEEISLLVELVNIKQGADSLKSRVASRGVI